jgi:hypothetical protein
MPKSQGEKGEKINIHNVINNKMTEFNHGDVFMDPMPYGFTWLLMPRRGLTQSAKTAKDCHAQITRGKGIITI